MASKSQKLSLILLLVAFVIPVILAKFALEQDWFNKASTNRGVLLQQPIDFSGIDNTNIWRISYFLPDKCDAACKNALYSMHQVWLALGREQERVESLVLVTDGSDASALEELQQQAVIRKKQVVSSEVQRVFSSQGTDGIFIVDTLNNVILRYPLQQEQQTAVLESRDILLDLKKLLKLSRIG